MFNIEASTPPQTYEAYTELNNQLAALLSGERDLICNGSQFSAFIMQTLESLNWAGFYFSRGKELVLGPYVGKVACTRIPFERGVCGAAATSQKTQRIEDVHAFEGHIACDAMSASELVIPILVDGKLMAVFDIDSPEVGRFSEVDQQGIELLVATFIRSTDFSWQFS